MGAFVFMLQRIFFPSNVVVLAGIVIAGALLYVVLVFRMERNLRKRWQNS